MAKLILEIETDLDSTQTQELLSKDTGAPHVFVNSLINFLEGVVSGQYSAAINCKLGAAAASKTGTFTGVSTANDTITINGVAFTAKTSGASGNQWNITASATLEAAAVAAAINASATAGIADVVYAEAASGVLTIKSKQAGKVGNAIVLSESCNNFTWAATALTGGTQATNKSYVLGKPVSTTY